MELRLLTADLKIGRVFGVVQVAPVKSQELLKVEEGGRKESIETASWEELVPTLPALKIDEGEQEPRRVVASRHWKGMEMDSALEPPEKNSPANTFI